MNSFDKLSVSCYLKKKTWKRAVFPGLVVGLESEGHAVDESKQREHYDD